MRLSHLSLLSSAVIPAFVFAGTIPEVAPRNGTLAKRGGEVNYLCNCDRIDYETDYVPYHASYIAWYSDGDHKPGDGLPESLSSEYRNWDAQGAPPLTWEGRQQNIYFPDSGVTVQTHIDPGANNLGFTSGAGWAQRTSDKKIFNCYRDNQRELFIWVPPVPDGTQFSITCRVEYWCV
ncbi:hypothetical protein M407DRAFT_22265 [Tulasnella calospora MUT 4182]|uniref:Ig-like domain-containing protein n=1 Tax=Tulasnella calospora MUT 4182 TaxID=1051891 RepID=A0A0C3QNB0_9AGAM|nr:hypothetical protein M407DRAFT_22265 [Tulasnella calospora MUT 4182]